MIKIFVSKWDKKSELYPNYDSDANLLEVSSKVPQGWLQGIDVDGNIIFDLDKNGVIANFDVLIPKDLWIVVENLCVPKLYKQGTVVVHPSSISKKSHNIPLTIQTDKKRKYVNIIIGNEKESCQNKVVEISKSCYCYVKNNYLKGFFLFI